MNKNKIVIAGLLIIAVFAIDCIDSFLSEPETEFQMRKVEVDINTVVNITPEELNKYPALESALSGEVCVDKDGYYSLCKVTRDDWKKIKDFIDSKRTNGTGPFCFKFGGMYGDTCYTFAFVRP